MAKNKNRRPTSTLTAVQHELQKRIQEAIRGISGTPHRVDGPESMLHPASAILPPLPRSQKEESSSAIVRLKKWVREFKIVPDLFPATTRPATGVLSVEILNVYKDGFIDGELKLNQGMNFRIFARITDENSDEPPVGCSCQLSRGAHPCHHGLYFAKHVAFILSLPKSHLVDIVKEGRFTEGEPDMSLYEHNEWNLFETFLSELDGQGVKEESTDTLSLVREKETGQFAWNIVESMGRLEVVPCKQTLSKRGDKWSKIKKMSWVAAIQANFPRRGADEKILTEFVTVSNSGNIQINPHAIIKCLVGQENVFLDSEPATVEVLDPILRIEEDKNGIKFQLDLQEHRSGRNYIDGTAIVHCDRTNHRLRVARCSPEEARAIHNAMIMPTVPARFRSKFMERAKLLQSKISVVLPEDVGGPTVDLEINPVLILRSHKNGSLEYGIRIRDMLGVLRHPGRGIMVISGERDKKPVQWLRSAKREFDKVQIALELLSLSKVDAEGVIEDFGSALNLIDTLEKSPSTVEVLWDKASEAPLKMIGSVHSDNVRVSVTKSRDWFNLEGKCQIGEESMEISLLLQSLRALQSGDIRGDFIRLGDKGWARISQDMRKKLRQLDDAVNHERKQLKFDQTSAVAFRDLQKQFSIDVTKSWTECMDRLERAEKLEPVLPTGLKAELRDYQVDGYKWLRRLAEWGVGGILADDMGLGKTLQTLGVLLDRAKNGPSLVIAPTSVSFNWMREANKFAPELKTHLYRETDRAILIDQLAPYDLVICSYGLALRDAELLAKVHWNSMVLDEAQAIKNGRSKTSQAIDSIPADWTIALTGTPVENHLGELWSLFKVVSPGVFGGWDQFRDRFAGPIEKSDDLERREALRTRLRPFILRRTKKEVLKDLPPRTEVNLYVELSPAERQLYESVRQSAIGEIDSLAKLPQIDDQRFKLLALLTRLRQIACNPKILHETWTEGTAKMDQLIEKVLELKQEGHRVLIFSQFVQHLALIRTALDQVEIQYQYLDGSTTPLKRQEEVDRFQNGDATAFLISLKAGGTGLNLTAADYVIHMDPWWNPAVEDQATDRAHRIGQDKPVMVYRIIAANTIEEEILKLHDTKRDLVAGVLEGAHSSAKLSTEDLIAMIRG